MLFRSTQGAPLTLSLSLSLSRSRCGVELHRRQFSRVGPDPQIHPQVALHPLVPGVVVQGAPADPLLVREALAVTEERSGVGADCMAELPGPALHDLQNSVADQ